MTAVSRTTPPVESTNLGFTTAIVSVATIGGSVFGYAQWFSNYLIAQSFPVMLGSLCLATSYSFYGGCAVISFFLAHRFIHETKGMELEEMEG